MRIAVSRIVVDVRGMNVTLQDFEGFGDFPHEMGMADIETYAQVVEVRDLYKLHQFVWRAQFIGNIFQQDTHAQRLSESAQVFNRSHCRFELAVVKRLAAGSQVLHQEAKRNLLS